MISRREKCNNGGLMIWLHWYTCDNCGTEMFEGDPRYSGDTDLCAECAYLLDKVSTEVYKRWCCYFPDNWHVGKHEGEIHWWTGKKAPWEKSAKDHRASLEYKKWRIDVFVRDNFTCRDCGQVRGKIEAHHIQKFLQFPSLRYDVNNGLTLCRKCHINVHRGKRNG